MRKETGQIYSNQYRKLVDKIELGNFILIFNFIILILNKIVIVYIAEIWIL